MTLNGVVLDPTVGAAISAEHLRIAEIINDYDPTLELVWIPPKDRNAFVKPFGVRHNPPGREPYMVFYLTESEVDYKIISRLFMGDNSKSDVVKQVEADEAALRLVNYKREMDAMEEAQDMASWALKTRRGHKLNGVTLE